MAGEQSIDPALFDEWHVVMGATVETDTVQSDRVRDAIDSLDPSHRDVINGVFYESIPKTEIAKRLGISRHEVRKLFNEALVLLAGALS